MNFFEIIFISIGVSMDAFTVATCKGLSMRKMDWKKALVIAFYFGVFQCLMPILGFVLSSKFKDKIEYIDHWIVFILLIAIGINMIKELYEDNEDRKNDDISFKNMISLSIATSIDAMAVGITWTLLRINIVMSSICIGIITFICSFIGVKIGNNFGNKFEKKAGLCGGLILILLGLKILFEHLNIL